MEMILNFLGENVYEILLAGAVIVSTIFNKPKTAQKLTKIAQKQKVRLEHKNLKEVKKMQERTAKIKDLEKEIQKNA